MIKRITSQHPDFTGLVQLLDQYLAKIDGTEHDFYKQYNTIDVLNHCLVLYINGVAVACGAIKRFNDNSFEIKRMYVHPNARGQGFAQQLVTALETWAQELGATHCLLETGKRMPDAVSLYKKMGYVTTPNYGQYQGVENSLCFTKSLS